jgi:hypothetical protein
VGSVNFRYSNWRSREGFRYGNFSANVDMGEEKREGGGEEECGNCAMKLSYDNFAIFPVSY